MRTTPVARRAVTLLAGLCVSVAAASVAASQFEYRIPVEGLRSTAAEPPVQDDEPLAPVAIQSYGTYRAWDDGTYASSCQAYRSAAGDYDYAGATGDGTYRIEPTVGSTVDTYCDMTIDNGGWTRVARITGTGTAMSMPTVPIDDKGLTYSEILMVAGPDKFSNYQTGKTDEYKGPGVNIAWDGLRFADLWYFAANTPTWRGYGANTESPWAVSFSNGVSWPNDRYTILAPVQGICRFKTTADAPDFCGSVVKVIAPVGVRLTGYNDIESLVNNVSDNKIVRTMDVFVR